MIVGSVVPSNAITSWGMVKEVIGQWDMGDIPLLILRINRGKY